MVLSAGAQSPASVPPAHLALQGVGDALKCTGKAWPGMQIPKPSVAHENNLFFVVNEHVSLDGTAQCMSALDGAANCNICCMLGEGSGRVTPATYSAGSVNPDHVGVRFKFLFGFLIVLL